MSRYIYMFSLLLQMCSAGHMDQLRIAEVGDSVHLPCLGSKDSKTTSLWMKQNPGEKPAVIATSYQQEPGTFKNGFEKSGRFKTHKSAESFNLTITDLEPSDTAIYYCAVIFFTDITFAEGTALVVKGAPLTSYKVHQEPVLEAVRPGGSVTLQCTVLTERCFGKHSVYWFSYGSGESHPGIIYTAKDTLDECTTNFESDYPTQSCIYELPMLDFSLSHAGTYYCAVAACGEIIFGDGTKLYLEDRTFWSPAVVALVTSNVLTVCAAVILGRLLYKYQQKCTTDDSQLNQNEENVMNYASLSFSQRPSTTRRTEKNQERSLYARVKIHEQEGE